jgi:hypothetical protein
VLSGAFRSDVLLTQALSYHTNHELVIQFHLLHYGSQACADGPEQALKVKKRQMNKAKVVPPFFPSQ